MKKSTFFLSVMIVLCTITPSHSLLLNSGESATYEFDFTSYSPGPPWNQYFMEVYGRVIGSGSFIGNPSGDLSYTAGTVSGPGFLFGGGSLLVPENSNLIWNVTVNVFSGWIDIDKIDLQLGYQAPSQAINYGQFITGSLISNTAPVPEPASMLLLGVGLISLTGFKRLKFNK